MKDPVPHIVLMPGLGVDDRIFDHLSFPFSVTRLNWLAPTTDEPWEAYVQRMKTHISQPRPLLIGVSHGGMLVQDLAKHMAVSGVVLISTLTYEDRLPPLLQLNRYLPFYRALRGSWRIKTLPVWAPLVGITNKGEQRLLMDMFSDQQDSYRIWAMKALLAWRGASLACPCLRIHGTHDHVFPAKHIRAKQVTWIEGGNHFMIYQQASQIQDLIMRWVESGYASEPHLG